MKIRRFTKHLLFIILTVSVLAVMLFIPELFLNYLDKDALSVKTEKSSPVTLELKSDLSLCQKAYISDAGERTINYDKRNSSDDVEYAARDIFDQICGTFLGYNETGEAQYDYEAEGEVMDMPVVECKTMMPLHCSIRDMDESCDVWYVVLTGFGGTIKMVLDDETLEPVDITITDESNRSYISDEMMECFSWLLEYVQNRYNVIDVHFVDEGHKYYLESDTGEYREYEILYGLTMYDDQYYFFNINVDVNSIHFGIATD